MNSPIKLEFFREMGRQGFDAESFSGVMTSEEKVDAQFFGGDGSPVRRFAGNESIHPFLSNAEDFGSPGTSHDANHSRGWRAEIEFFDFAA